MSEEQNNANRPPELPKSEPTQQPEPLAYATAKSQGAYAYEGPPPSADSKNMAMLCHLLAIFTGFLAPLIIWLIKKDQDRFVDIQGKEALNFQITVILAVLCCLPCFCVPPAAALLVLGIQVVRIVFCIIATVQASSGSDYRYPICLRLVT
jgi:uncharacterized Tic20 family protein